MKNYIKYGIIVLIGIVILIGAMHAPNRQDLFSIIMNIFTKIVAVITILGGLGGLLIWSINRKQFTPPLNLYVVQSILRGYYRYAYLGL